jgi:hypothetical protein
MHRFFVLPAVFVGCLASIESLRPEGTVKADGGSVTVAETGADVGPPASDAGQADAVAVADAKPDANLDAGGAFCLSQTDSPVFCNDFDRGEGPAFFGFARGFELSAGIFSLQPSQSGQGNSLHFTNVGFPTPAGTLTRLIQEYTQTPSRVVFKANLKCDVECYGALLFLGDGAYTYKLYLSNTGVGLEYNWPTFTYLSDSVDALNQWVSIEFVLDFGPARQWTLKRNGVPALSGAIPNMSGGAAAPAPVRPSLSIGPVFLDHYVTQQWDNVSFVLQ